jgi:iron complex outermembrane receptor protein
VAPVAGFSINILPTLKFYGNYQAGFRFPTLNELYLFPSSNADLEEESINSLESGIWYYWSNDNTLRLTIFRNNVQNIIQSLEYLSPPPLFKYVNSGKAIQMGIEAQVNYRILPDFNIQLSYSYLNPDHLTAYNPKHQIKYLLSFKRGRFHSTLYGKYIDHLFTKNYAIQESRLPDYNLVNLILSYNFTELDIYIRLLNLLNRDYIVGTQPNYPAPGFHFMVGVRYHLE